MTFLLTGLALNAHAKPIGWLHDGAASTKVAGTVEVALYRGPETNYLPAIGAKVPVADQVALRSTLAVIDLAGGWSTLTLESANALGVDWEWQQVRGEWRRLAVLERIELGEVVLTEVHVEVISEGPAPFVLGMPTFDQLAIAILPSKGTVQIVPASDGLALLDSIAPSIAVSSQPTSSWTAHGKSFRGNGVTLRIPGALRWGAAVSEGTFHVRTASPTSRVAESSRLPPATPRAGVPHHDVEARLGDAWLAHTWVQATTALSDPDPAFSAELGYDVLYGLDIGVDVSSGRMAFRKASAVQFTPARDVAVPYARERFDQEEERRPATAVGEGRVQIGFDGPKKTQVALGDPGDPAIRDRNLDLADTLWFAGALDDALPYYLAASQHAGDHCLTHLRLAQRRLAWSGKRQSQSFVVDLIRQPLERAGQQWNTWIDLDEKIRQAIWEGQSLPDAPLQVYQPLECQVSWGLLLAAYTAQGNTAAADELSERFQGDDPAVDYARGLRFLSNGDLGTAQPLLASSRINAGIAPVDSQAALALASAPVSADKVKALVRTLPHYASDHELTTAFAALEAARQSGDVYGVGKSLLRADSRWMPGLLASAVAMDQPPPEWDPSLQDRFADAPQLSAWRAVQMALAGDLDGAQKQLTERPNPAIADWWTATAVVAWKAGDEARRVEALEELHLRYPLLPGGQFGTLPVPKPEPEPPAPAPRRRR